MTQKVLALFMAVSVMAAASSSPGAMELYQRALVQEQAAGDLAKAIELYRQAAKEAGSDRDLAARALIRAAGAYEKLGQTAQPAATELYNEVIRTYPEQREQVALAQARLVVLRRPAARGAQSASRTARTDVSAVFGPMFEAYCTSCHNNTRKSAGLALDSLNTNDVSENTAVWEKILMRLRARRDPSAVSAKHPDESVYQSAVSTLELALDQAYPVNASLRSADRVSDNELAARIARFIWNAAPDSELMNAVQKGRLREPAVLEQQVRRMLRDPKATSLTTDFLERWMNVDSLQKANVSGFDEGLRQAFQTETRLFLESQVREDHNVLDLWTANYSFINDRLARHYGISGVSGGDFQRVTYTDNSRAGILGQGSFLTVSSFNDRTSPVQRGKLILRMFTGVVPPPPPPNVSPLSEDTRTGRPLTMRERMDQHHSNPACAGCHATFEPMGIAMENFNSLGQWRNTDNGVPIDASGMFVDGTRFNGPVELRAGLVKYKDAYYAIMAQTLLGYAMGRPAREWRVYDYEMPSVRAVVREAAADGYRWSALVVGIVKSTPFQMKTSVP